MGELYTIAFGITGLLPDQFFQSCMLDLGDRNERINQAISFIVSLTTKKLFPRGLQSSPLSVSFPNKQPNQIIVHALARINQSLDRIRII
jgi:hypothetical protein